MLIPDPWQHLRSQTPARIALGRAGGSIPTRELLRFAADHAQARDAVQAAFDPQALASQLAELNVHPLVLATGATDRKSYLTRPDWGRQLAPDSARQLQHSTAARSETDAVDLAIIVSDGLSALAAERQTVPLLRELVPRLTQAGWRLSPVIVLPFARVAVQDEVGQLLQARLALILLGERPGLLSPDSLGAYLVYGPRPGRTDADRNCVSNIRPEGLPPAHAAEVLYSLLAAARQRQLSGVALKDERPARLAGQERGLADGR